MDTARRLILLGGWAAGVCGIVGSILLVTSAFSASPSGGDYVSSLRSLGIAPVALAFWLALPSLCVVLGATIASLTSRRSWLHLAGEALLLIGVTANVGLAGLGWYTVTGASWLVVALFAVAVVLAIVAGVAFIVGEIGSGRAPESLPEREQVSGGD